MQYLDVNNIFTLNENVYNRILKENEYKIVNAAGIFKKLVDKFQIEFSFSIWSMKNDFVTGVDEKNIYVYFDNDISDQKYRTYYELSGKNIKDKIVIDRPDARAIADCFISLGLAKERVYPELMNVGEKIR